jgi:hypothetical protein
MQPSRKVPHIKKVDKYALLFNESTLGIRNNAIHEGGGRRDAIISEIYVTPRDFGLQKERK